MYVLSDNLIVVGALPHARPLHANRRMPPSVSIYPFTIHILFYHVFIYIYIHI